MKRLKEMKKPCIRVLSIMLVVIVTLVATTQPLLAAKQADNPLLGSKIEQEYTRATNKLERYLSISETGNIVLDAPNGIVNSIDSEVYQSLLSGIEQTNSMIDKGYLICNDDFTLTVTEKYLESGSQYLESNSQLIAEGNTVYLVEGIQTLSFSGVNKVEWYWWGFKLWLDNATCIRICAGFGYGAIIAALLGGPLGVLVCILLAGMVALILATNVYGRGVIIRFHTITGFPIPTGIWSQ
jgi:hypothetical protein